MITYSATATRDGSWYHVEIAGLPWTGLNYTQGRNRDECQLMAVDLVQLIRQCEGLPAVSVQVDVQLVGQPLPGDDSFSATVNKEK